MNVLQVKSGPLMWNVDFSYQFLRKQVFLLRSAAMFKITWGIFILLQAS